ncbi:hypothetical protein CP97_07105 [Aurantiacibacter atlanticus]|uniref:Uncharacterized protein n=1 Tax=Aurantiacibacter atlanticus TaxID=1648404 RepID=A0A0H4VBP4_9SPHN|nr:hypothetical protein CP97_07105 [Aurantiacibacter atlanticus]
MFPTTDAKEPSEPFPTRKKEKARSVDVRFPGTGGLPEIHYARDESPAVGGPIRVADLADNPEIGHFADNCVGNLVTDLRPATPE